MLQVHHYEMHLHMLIRDRSSIVYDRVKYGKIERCKVETKKNSTEKKLLHD